MQELAWVIKFVLHTNRLKLIKFCLKYETFQERRLVVARVGCCLTSHDGWALRKKLNSQAHLY